MKKCEICGNTKRVVNYKKKQLLCIRHDDQMRRYGKILERTRFDKNEIIHTNGYCEVVIRNHKHEDIARAKFDKIHLACVTEYRWSMSTGGYARCTKIGKNLHQIIMGKPPVGHEIDHINGDRLDNRDENLRIVTHSQNGKNLKISKRNKSGYPGIWWDKNNNAWQVKLCHNGEQLFFGRHKNYNDALVARVKAERQYFSQYVRNRVA